MTTASLTQGIRANTPTARNCSADCKKLQSAKLTAEIIRISQNAITGGSFRKVLANWAKCSLRTIDYWISSDSDVGMQHFFNMLEEPQGVACMKAFWDQVPERVRDRFFAEETLRRAIEEKRRQREVEDREHQARLDQLNMELRTR